MAIPIWIKAFRLRTLPLALSCTILGSFLAGSTGKFHVTVFILASITTLFLQILSNLANDYGDTVHGADNKNRIGPERLTQSGLVSRKKIRYGITWLGILSFVSGTLLVLTALHDLVLVLFFFTLGILAIAAALKYTVGKKPYAYVGLGDFFVFLFFGLTGTLGTYFLHTHAFNNWLLLPASSLGLLSAGVLNINNMRDITNDRNSGKKTLVVRMGLRPAKIYHTLLISTALLLSIIYCVLFFHTVLQFLFVVTIPFFILDIRKVLKNTEPVELNNELGKLALSTFAFTIFFGLGQIL